MNYRHQFHAGNFADVMKHAVLGWMVRALQRKEKGFLYLDTHAGRGRYDLEIAATGDSLARKPEWPDGIGRLWARGEGEVPGGIADYLKLVRDFDRQAGNLKEAPRFYPGSPWMAKLVARPVERLVFCEKQPQECAALRADFEAVSRSSVHLIDGYDAMRAMLPPMERRALVFMDPPFEAEDEFAKVTTSLGEALRRFRSGVFVTWYPLTHRARLDEFFAAVRRLNPPTTIAAELTIAGEQTPLKMKGCGLLVMNPPWRFEEETRPILEFLADALAQAPGGGARFEWIVRAPARPD